LPTLASSAQWQYIRHQVGFGHNRPVSLSQPRSFERQLYSENCRMTYFGTSAKAAALACPQQCLQLRQLQALVLGMVMGLQHSA
jgi:hypothetical protein